MSEPTSISSGIAERYAAAIFDLAKDESGLATLEKHVAELSAALEASPELNVLINSPVYSRDEQ
ncbi:MAG: F0F1 ATP synthase subunit delta, partial [Paracoccaceae bacterium]